MTHLASSYNWRNFCGPPNGIAVAGLVVERVRGETVVAEELVCRTAQLVRAGLHQRVDDAAGGASVLG